MDAPAQLRAAIEADGMNLPLDIASDLIAAHLDNTLAPGSTIRRLDALAVETSASGPQALVQDLIHTFGFRGNHADYYDSANSLLPHVIDRRLGIPITLAVVAIEVGRRIDCPITGVGMPGHFLIRLGERRGGSSGGDSAVDAVFADLFTGTVPMTIDGCRQRFRSVVGDRMAWSDDYLAPVESLEIVSRMLNNLKAIHLKRSEVDALRGVLELRACLPGMPIGDWTALAVALAARGRYGDAAMELEQLADRCDAEERTGLLRRAQQLRAKLN